MDDFTTAYIEAALWSTNDESDEQGGVALDRNYSASDIAPESLAKIIADCERFQRENAAWLASAYELYEPRDGYRGAALAGHDFWLTRNGHGVGFWCRDELGDYGEHLSKAANAFGELWPYVGDDGQLWGF